MRFRTAIVIALISSWSLGARADQDPVSKLNYVGEGSFIKSSGSTVYVIENGQKRAIPDPITLHWTGNGEKTPIMYLEDRIFGYIPNGPALPSRILKEYGLIGLADAREPWKATGYIFQVVGGKRRHIPDPKTLEAMHLATTYVLPLSVDQLNAVPLGPTFPIQRMEGSLVSDRRSIFRIENGTRRGFPDPETLSSYYQGKVPSVETIDGRIVQIPLGAPYPRGVFYANGDLVRGSGPEVYRIDAGKKRHIPDPGTFRFMRLDTNKIKRVSDNQLAAISIGVPYPWGRDDGTLIQDSRSIYKIEHGKRRGYPDPETFHGDLTDGVPIEKYSDGFVATIPEGPPFPSWITMEGRLLRATDPGIYQMQGGLRRWIPDPDTLAAMGLSNTYVLRISDKRMKSIPFGPPFPPQKRK